MPDHQRAKQLSSVGGVIAMRLSFESSVGQFLRSAALFGLALSESVLAPVGAQAQEVAAEPQTDSMQEIIVTARKRSETMQDIPESIEALGAQELANAHVTKLDDLGGLISNLNIVTRADNSPDVVLRGVGSFGVVNGVGFYADDVQLFDGQTVRPEDLERIEVLKGPQGTLYGGSNIGGAIKYVTKRPTDAYEGQASFEFGKYDTKTYSAFVSGPLVSGLSGRVSFYDSTTDGYIYDTTLNKTVDSGFERGGRITLAYDGEATSATLYLNGVWNRSGAGASLYYTPASTQDYSLNIADGTQPDYSRSLYSATLNVAHKISDELALTSISSFFHSNSTDVTDIDKGPLPFLTGFDTFRHSVWSQELRLASSGDGALKWLIGAFGQGNNPERVQISRSFNGDPSNPANFLDPTLYSNLTTDATQRHNEYAVFGNASYDWHRWTFEAGLRADYNNSSMTDPLHGLAAEQHGTEILPKMSAAYHIDKDVMLYGTISRGFEPGDLIEQFDASNNPVISRYKPETTWNYELGIKSTLFDRVRLNAALFYIDYQNRLFQTNVLQAGTLVGVTRNIGSSHNYGGEFDVSTRVSKDLFVSASFGVTKAIWNNVPYFDSDLGQSTNLQGRTAPFTPEYQGSLSLDWSHHLTQGLTLGARGDVSFVGREYWDVTDHYSQLAYQLVNLGLRLEGRQWAVAGHVSNLFDKRYNTTFISAAELQAPYNVAGIGRPRLWTVTLTYRW
jgi:iron complex outermembrane receptor protein